MRQLGEFIVVLLIAASDAAAPRRDKRQVVPLYAACDQVYSTCAPPAVCMSGQCQCAQPYVAMQSACASPYQSLLSPVLSHAAPVAYYQSQPALLHYPAQQLQAAPLPQQPPVYQAPPHVAPPPQQLVPQPLPTQQVPHPAYPYPPPPQEVPGPHPGQPIPLPGEQGSHPLPPPLEGQPLPPYLQPTPLPPLPPTFQPVTPRVDQPVTDVATQPTTSNTRLFDEPQIAYPGDYCQLPMTVCVGGSVCNENVCMCRRGEEPVNGQCERVEIPLMTETPGVPPTLISIPSTTAFPQPSSTTTMSPTTMTTTPSTTTPMTSSSVFTDTTRMPTTASTTIRNEVTTVPTSTPLQQITPVMGREDIPLQAIPYPNRCVNCCQPGANKNCRNVIRIDLSYPQQSRRSGCPNCPR